MSEGIKIYKFFQKSNEHIAKICQKSGSKAIQ